VSSVVLRYTLLRLGLFAAALVLLALAGARGVLLLVLGVVISLALSYLLLARQRDAVARAIAERVEARAADHRPGSDGSDEAVEDAADDARRARLAEPAGPAGPAGPQEDRAPNASPRPSSTP
jgi:hypothetical protein